ncbi:hypothetical protein GTP41_20825 [Pseudoduganella sp. DS3]|uniref:Uncharacterized protein n=1 Tax=Pseudoduganella guangdongensis TaxID=2692179 RepID=A0A6N9HM18_9BURK|nr:hypothetical protein [Pseudoduganella guangdongensis]MYN04540.1 hypothetical protein [Pseudoduganella guangdongensis]
MKSQVASDSFIDRCASLGLTLNRAKELAREDDANDADALARVLGMDTQTLLPVGARHWTRMAAQGASVSYREVMDERSLVEAISSGQVPTKYFAHICMLLDEVPLQVVVMACHQVAQQNHIAMDTVWNNVAILARLVGARRARFWSAKD